jgi:hypothetical protein
MINTKEVKKEVQHIRMVDAARLLGVKYTTLRAHALRHRLAMIRIPLDGYVYMDLADVEELQRARAKVNKI